MALVLTCESMLYKIQRRLSHSGRNTLVSEHKLVNIFFVAGKETSSPFPLDFRKQPFPFIIL